MLIISGATRLEKISDFAAPRDFYRRTLAISIATVIFIAAPLRFLSQNSISMFPCGIVVSSPITKCDFYRRLRFPSQIPRHFYRRLRFPSHPPCDFYRGMRFPSQTPRDFYRRLRFPSQPPCDFYRAIAACDFRRSYIVDE